MATKTTKTTTTTAPEVVSLSDLYTGVPASRNAIGGGGAVGRPHLSRSVQRDASTEENALRNVPPAFTNGGPLSMPGVVEALDAYRAARREHAAAGNALHEARSHRVLKDPRSTQTERDTITADLVRPAEDRVTAAARTVKSTRRRAVEAVWSPSDDVLAARRAAYVNALEPADTAAREAVEALSLALTLREQAHALLGAPARTLPVTEEVRRKVGGSWAHWTADGDSTKWAAVADVREITYRFPTMGQITGDLEYNAEQQRKRDAIAAASTEKERAKARRELREALTEARA